MKHLAVALIVVSLVAADFGADLWLDAHDNHGWDVSLGWGLIFAGLWFFHHRDRES